MVTSLLLFLGNERVTTLITYLEVTAEKRVTI